MADDVIVKFGASLENVDRGLKQLEQELQKLKVDTRQVADSTNLLASAVKGLAAAFSLNAAVQFIDNIGSMGEKAERTADMLGLTTEQVTSLQFATAVAGGSADQMTSIMERLARTMDAAASGGKAQVEAFKEAGVQWRAADGSLRPLPDVINDLADAFQRAQNGPEKTALAMELMGRSGAEAIPLLNGGSEGLRDMAREAEKAGFVLSGDLAHAMGETGDKLDVLQLSLQGFGIRIFTALKPAIDTAIDAMTKFVQSMDAKQISGALNGLVDLIANIMLKIVELANGAAKIINEIWIRGAYLSKYGIQAFNATNTNAMLKAIEDMNAAADVGLQKSIAMFTAWRTTVRELINPQALIPGAGSYTAAMKTKEEQDKPKFVPPAAPLSSEITSSLNSVQSAIEAVEKLKLSIQDQIVTMGMGTAAATAYTEEHKVLALAQINNVRLTEKQQAALKQYAQEAGEAKAQLETLNAQQDAMRGIAEGIAGAFGDWLNGTTSLGDALVKMTLQLAAAVAEALLLNLILSAMGLALPTTGLGAALGPLFGGGKAEGGPMEPGQWYMAGERGPEPVWTGGIGAFASGYGQNAGQSSGAGGPSAKEMAHEISKALGPMLREQTQASRRLNRTVTSAVGAMT